MPADALDPSDAPASAPVAPVPLPTERQRALRATVLGAGLGAILAVLGRRRRGTAAQRYSRQG
jgi:hypothetical protein